MEREHLCAFGEQHAAQHAPLRVMYRRNYAAGTLCRQPTIHQALYISQHLLRLLLCSLDLYELRSGLALAMRFSVLPRVGSKEVRCNVRHHKAKR